MKKLGIMEKEKIRKQAETLLEQYNFNYEVDVMKIAEDLGFSIGNANLSDRDDGFILVNEDVKEILGVKNNKIIGVNANRDLETKRFIIAHELGHYVLFGKDKKIFAQRERNHGRNDTENDIDFFAACLLMPEKQFRNTINEIKSKNENISEYYLSKELGKMFSVPQLSALRRMDEIAQNKEVSNG